MKAPQYNSSLRKRFLAFAAALVLLFALVFELYPRSSQIIDLSTGSGLSRMLRYDDAQVYIFGEIHRKVEYQKFRNVLFKYLVEKKGVRVLLWSMAMQAAFIENETIQNRMTFSDAFDQFTISQEDYELFRWMSEFNRNRPDKDKISIVGADITDSIEMLCTFCKYLLKDCDFSAARQRDTDAFDRHPEMPVAVSFSKQSAATADRADADSAGTARISAGR